jgi:hypothetical protein
VNAFEFVLTVVLELDARPSDQVFDGGGHQYLARRGGVSNAGADVHGEACDIVATDFNLPRVHAHSYVDAQSTDRVPDGDGTVDRASRPAERGQRTRRRPY